MPQTHSPESVPPWRKSSFSGLGGDCVEVAHTDSVAVRDSKHPTAGTLSFPHPSWSTLLHTL
ncbi:DUF397 domain-containing protein [Actinokineospora sp. NBRC 105648]|uniref:DUF397 domain-containing protein n=1 Tax=Actinokineospora sp. NBRC 105648 TaxID=3032206 RepID=UPI0024A3F075|nr:DUF397 domain-containing protein [Actinokineospora sp. NBRC 105648]GLZ38934.1 hypothetical protein Acsp05_25580 [Actinokineospora sp. NBRC 105648]